MNLSWPLNLASSQASVWSLRKTKQYECFRGVVAITNLISLWCKLNKCSHWIGHVTYDVHNNGLPAGCVQGHFVEHREGKCRRLFRTFIYATSSGSCSAGTPFLIRITFLLFSVNTVGENIQWHPLCPDTWVHDFPRRNQSRIKTTMERHVSHDHINSLFNLNVTLVLPLAAGPGELSNYQ